PLFGGMERETLDVLDRVLRGTAFRVFGQVRLADVLEPESGDELLPGDQRFLLMSHFDFVVVDRRTQLPVFAVEFDGPLHELSPQELRDIRKNRLCAAVDFPLLRIGYATLERYEQLSVLEFMLQRFVAWQREHVAIKEWIDDSLSRLSAEEIGRRVEVRLRRGGDSVLFFLRGGALANSADPSFWFNLQHKFPGLQVVARRLLDKFGIVASPYIPEAAISGLRLGGRYWRCNVSLAAEHYPGDYVVKTVGYSVYQHDETIPRPKRTNP